MTDRKSLRFSTAALALLAAGWIGAAAPAFAASTHDSVVIPPGEPTSPSAWTDNAAPDGMYRVPNTAVMPRGRAAQSTAAEGAPGALVTVPDTAVMERGRAARSSPVEGGAVLAAPVPTKGNEMGATAVPTHLRGLLRDADAALAANRLAVARDRLEQAETALLNARSDGEHGFGGTVRDIASARAAIGMGNRGAAQQELARAVQSLDRAGG